MAPRPARTPKDNNQAEIVAQLRALGFTVIITADLPGDAVSHPLDCFILDPAGRNWLQVEVKDQHSARFTIKEQLYLRQHEVELEVGVINTAIPIAVVRSVYDVLDWFNAHKKED